MQETINAGLENSRSVKKAHFIEVMESEDLLQASINKAFIEAQYQIFVSNTPTCGFSLTCFRPIRIEYLESDF
jgi:hypothetical protein